MFETIQGEGAFTGVPSVFIRLQGCPVGCAWCDTKQTWNTDEQDRCSIGDILVKQMDSPLWTEITASELVKVYQKQMYTAKHIVITGGEPCIFNLTELTEAFEAIGCKCQVETSGTFEVLASSETWVTLSPKIGMRGKLPIIRQALMRANEIKHPVATQKDIDQLDDLISSVELRSEVQISLQPISQKIRATTLCIETCRKRNWRLSIQTHKYLNIA
ncbi:7-carboxy-7-deazaguanine synthase QueE [Vibrio salinus]|uniref:7-carboxy-7-deazaguanine synthase QueE n=1 Tax=Vibrio salinus TaxID=2899784 RepID=UPI001E5030ED|nr:7-carboxy-7-deazaguanine synthase QueE [Vibrio salinus]MCE0492469.1 7-carboxy-7-deazaguanine synthase QueE [Vibrio salinus]